MNQTIKATGNQHKHQQGHTSSKSPKSLASQYDVISPTMFLYIRGLIRRIAGKAGRIRRIGQTSKRFTLQIKTVIDKYQAELFQPDMFRTLKQIRDLRIAPKCNIHGINILRNVNQVMPIMTMPGEIRYNILGILFLEITRRVIILRFIYDYQGIIRNILLKMTYTVRIFVVVTIIVIHKTEHVQVIVAINRRQIKISRNMQRRYILDIRIYLPPLTESRNDVFFKDMHGLIRARRTTHSVYHKLHPIFPIQTITDTQRRKQSQILERSNYKTDTLRRTHGTPYRSKTRRKVRFRTI